jgi:hypothetical protein
VRTLQADGGGCVFVVYFDKGYVTPSVPFRLVASHIHVLSRHKRIHAQNTDGLVILLEGVVYV